MGDHKGYGLLQQWQPLFFLFSFSFSLTGFTSVLVLELHPLPMPPSSPLSFIPFSCPPFSFHPWNTSLSCSLPSGLCLLELQVKLGGTVSYDQQILVLGTPAAPLPPFHHPTTTPQQDPHHSQGRRKTSRLRESYFGSL